ncbi:MAG: XRE family transcriptional regulator [Chitinophagaceae bacterium]|nr:MAG: XRE family transcriptional regulator [Chitinophagaceae bacterium]
MKASQLINQQSGIGAIRRRLGLTLRGMAAELGISAGHLSKVENKKRSLSTDALFKLSALEVRFISEKGSMNGEATAIQAPVVEDWAGFARAAADKAAKLERRATDTDNKLKRMVASYDRVRSSIEEVEKLLQSEEEPILTPKHLELHKALLLAKLNSCGFLAQATLRNKAALLRAESHLNLADAQEFAARAALP